MFKAKRSVRPQQQTSRRPLQLEALESRELLAIGTPPEKSFSFLPAHVLNSTVSDLTAVHQPAVAKASLVTDDVYEQNDTFGTAYNLGTLTSPRTLNSLAMADSVDWYRFTTSRAGVSGNSVVLNFQHAQGDVDLALYNIYGQRLRLSEGVTNSETVSLSGLAAGTYYVRAYGYGGVTNPAYSLSVKVGTAVTDDAYEDNDAFGAAANLGTLTGSKSVSSLVLADSADWYKFTMNGQGTSGNSATLSFQNSVGNLDLELYSSAGARLASSTSLTNVESVSLAGRTAGTYYLRVYSPAGITNSSYSLSVTPGVATTPPTSGSFDIQFVFSGLSTTQQAIFEQAAAKWESIIVGDLPSVTYNGQVIDDLLITATATSIDGVGNILGQAGPDQLRSGSLLPYAGSMEFDSADLASMQSSGSLLGVIEHEMGHVLGIGTLWSAKGLLVGAGTSNPLFKGAQALAAYNSIFVTTASGVPVENTGGSGTADAHWRESVFVSELMTGWVGPSATMPISRITVGSLADIGYTVNMAAADTFTPFSSASLLSPVTSSTTSTTSVRLRDEGQGARFKSHAAHDAALVSLVGASESPHSPMSSARARHELRWENAVDGVLATDWDGDMLPSK